MLILGFILLWILCGLVAVYLSGRTGDMAESAPLVVLLTAGPFGIVLSLIMILVAGPRSKILTAIQRLGMRD